MHIDLHIELSSLIEFYNEEKSAGREVLFTPSEILEAAKNAVLFEEKSPFFTYDPAISNAYYEKYVEEASENDQTLVPDFFQHHNDFYDLESPLYVKYEIGYDHFSKLFILKILKTYRYEPNHVDDFFEFQLFDNFFGDIIEYQIFLNNITTIARNFQQLPTIVDNWKKKSIKKHKISSNQDWDEFLASKKNYKIPGKKSDDDIKYFFTFLCDEKKKQGAYLQKEEVDIIFRNGLTIPEAPLPIKFKLNYNNRRVKKAVYYGIYLLYQNNSPLLNDKNDYILFFAHYIEDFSSALMSRRQLNNFNSNMKGKPSKFWNISWADYLKKP